METDVNVSLMWDYKYSNNNFKKKYKLCLIEIDKK